MNFYKLYQGDCLKALPMIEEDSVDLVVTSPPYNLRIDYGNYKDNLEWNDYYEWCKKWFKEIYRILKWDGRFCVNHYFSCGPLDNKSTPLMEFNLISNEIGFKHYGLAFWTDNTIAKLTAWGSWLSASAPFISAPFEGVLILYKGLRKKATRGKSTICKWDFMLGCSGIWNIGTDHKRLTPSTFPEKLPELCINLLSYEDDTILDPFLGSGTTMKVAQDLHRNCIGMELNPEYCKIIKDRCFNRTDLDREIDCRVEVI